MRYADRLALLLDLAQEVGTLTLEGWGRSTAEAKSDAYDLATHYDRASEARVRARIGAAFPGEPILGEEGGLEGDPDVARRHCWIVDPVDGTHNYQRGLPLYGVSIAYCADGVPVVGVLYLPATRQCYYAVVGEGAFGIDPAHGPDPFPLRPAHHAELLMDLTGPHYFELTAACDAEGIPRQALRYLRAAVPTFALVATGGLDVACLTSIYLWDVAAAHVVLHEAGAVGPVGLSGLPHFPEALFRWLDGSDRGAIAGVAVSRAELLEEPLARILRRAGL